MIVHATDQTVSQADVLKIAAKSVIKALASYFNVTESKMEKALKNSVMNRKTPMTDEDETLRIDGDGFREIEENRFARRRG